MNQLRLSNSEESTLQASKWLYVQALLDNQEMVSLFEFINPFFLASCGTVSPLGEGVVSQNKFLDHYKSYIDSLQIGELLPLEKYQSVFSCAMTTSLDTLYAIPIGESQQLVRVSKPVIQMQSCNIAYSTEDKKFYAKVFGSQNIRWGVQFGYPQLYQDPKTKEVITIRNSPDFPNSELFHLIQKWIRSHTIPTPFFVDNVLTNVPMRLGKNCLSWINKHPQLIEKKIKVV